MAEIHKAHGDKAQQMINGGDMMKIMDPKPNPKAPLGQGGRFATVKSNVAAEYRAKGKSPAEAARIAGAVAANAGRAKYGNKKMAQLSARGRA